jgi:GNAT superfamily N-acetyltransferase
MSGPPCLRLLTVDDLPFADSLRALAGWNQTLSDWERFLAFDAAGCFLAEWEGRPAGVVCTLTYSSEMAWIGMLLVHPDYRRRGIGSALLKRAVEHLRGSGIRTIKLDATPEGQPTYAKFGFTEERTLTRWEGTPRIVSNSKVSPGNVSSIEDLDMLAFGVSRARLLQALRQQDRTILHHLGNGYGMLRPGAHAWYLGPIVARTIETGLDIASVLLAETPEKRVFWDILDQNERVAAWARKQGFRAQRTLIRMYLGERNVTGNPEMQIAIAGPELG